MAKLYRFPLLLCFSMILLTAQALSSKRDAQKSPPKEHLKLLRAYEEFEAHVEGQLKQAFVMIDKFSRDKIQDPDAKVVKIEDSEGFMAKLTEVFGNVEDMEMTLEELLLATFMSSWGIQQRRAYVPQPAVLTKLNASVNFSCECESNGTPLSLCMWTHNGKGQEIIMGMDGERQTKDGVVYTDEGLNSGKCSVRIEKIEKGHLGKWDCTLVTIIGHVFTADVEVSVAGASISVLQPNVQVYYVTDGGDVKVFSPSTTEVETVTTISEALFAIAYDTIRNKIYWTSMYQIYRCDANSCGGSIETILNTSYHRVCWGLGFDYLTGNIYVVSSEGYILACDGSPSRPFNCSILLSGQLELRDIAVHPTAGFMYWTQYPGNGTTASIFMSEMDGSNATRIISDLRLPCGVVIDFHLSRLYWADDHSKSIESSDLDGGDRRIIVSSLPEGPFGLAVANERLYWGYYNSKEVQSSTKDGLDTRIEYSDTDNTRHFTVPLWNVPRNRTNDCEEAACHHVCVLTRSSFRCVE